MKTLTLVRWVRIRPHTGRRSSSLQCKSNQPPQTSYQGRWIVFFLCSIILFPITVSLLNHFCQIIVIHHFQINMQLDSLPCLTWSVYHQVPSFLWTAVVLFAISALTPFSTQQCFSFSSGNLLKIPVFFLVTVKYFIQVDHYLSIVYIVQQKHFAWNAPTLILLQNLHFLLIVSFVRILFVPLLGES